MTILKTGRGAMLARGGAVMALSLAAVGAVATNSQAAASVMTLSSITGSPNGGNSITLTLAAPTTTANNKFASGNVTVQFQYSATPAASTSTCAATPADVTLATGPAAGAVTVLSAAVRYLSTSKVSITVPDLHTGPSTWMVCAYAATATGSPATYSPTSPTVLGKASYTTTTPPGTGTLSTSSGPALGGQTVTVTGGSGYPTTINSTNPLGVTIGGVAVPAANITAISSSSFSFVTPPHVASTAQTVVVTTSSGSSTPFGSYSFLNGIDVQPDFVQANTSTTDLDISGVGFSNLTFSAGDEGVSSPDVDMTAPATHAGTNTPNAHVYFVRGTYSATGFGGVGGANKANGQLGECKNVAVISDTELICTADTTHKYNAVAGAYTWTASALPTDTYTVTIVNSGESATPTYQTVLSSGATVTVAAF